MKLIKLSSNKTELVIMGILCILVFNNSHVVVAEEPHFTENFNGEPNEDWRFGAWFYPPSKNYQETNHTFSYDGELISSGVPDKDVTNYAYINDTTVFGAWSLDIYIPANPLIDVWGNIFVIDWSYDKPALYVGEPGAGDFAEIVITGFEDGLNLGAWNKSRDPDSDQLIDEKTSAGLKFDTYQHFDIIRTPDSFRVYIDQNLVLEYNLSTDIGPEINYFGVLAAKGSDVKFDNIEITVDYQGVMNSLNPTSNTDSGSVTDSISKSESSPDEGKSTNGPLFYGAAVGVIALTGSASFYRITQKKR